MNRLLIRFMFIGVISFLVIVLLFVLKPGESITTLKKTYPLGTLVTYKNGELMKGDIIAGQFTASENNLGIVAVRFETFQRVKNDRFAFRIKQKGNSDWYYINEYNAKEFGGYPLFPFGFPIITESEGKDYYFELESLNGKPGDAVGIKTEEPVVIVTHKFTTAQLLSDTKKLFLFTFQKIRDVFSNKKALQDFVFVYVLITISVMILQYNKEIFRYVKNSAVRSKNKTHVWAKKIFLIGPVLRRILKILEIAGKITLQTLSFFQKWLGKE